MCYLKLLKLETFQPITGVGYLKLSDETWNEMCYLKFWNFSTFSNPSWELLICNFQIRFETRYAVWNVWNLKLYKHVMGVAYLKLSDETCYLKLLKFETFQTHDGGCLFETFGWDLKWDVLLELLILETFQPITGVGYLKLSDETWNEMCYLKFLETWNFTNMSWELLIWNFQMRLEKEVLFETFEIWNFSTHHRSWLFETFGWDLKWDVLSEIFETFQPFQTHHESCLFETCRWDLKQEVLFETFETWNFTNMSWELLIWNFQMRLEKDVLFETFETWNFAVETLKLLMCPLRTKSFN